MIVHCASPIAILFVSLYFFMVWKNQFTITEGYVVMVMMSQCTKDISEAQERDLQAKQQRGEGDGLYTWGCRGRSPSPLLSYVLWSFVVEFLSSLLLSAFNHLLTLKYLLNSSTQY